MKWTDMNGRRQLLPTICIILISVGRSLAMSCDWPTGAGRLNPVIPDTQFKNSTARDSNLCRWYCQREVYSLCAGVNFKHAVSEKNRTCQLLTENMDTAEVVEPDSNWTYFIKPLCQGIWLPWTAEKGSYIEADDVIYKPETSLLDCQTSCLANPTNCNAINKQVSGTNCSLQSKRVGNKGVKATPSTDWQFFNRPIWYLESSKAASSGEIKYKGKIDRRMHIFLEEKIAVSGYLVALQYYMQEDNHCDSSFAIWRKISDHNFTLIGIAGLSWEVEFKAGVKFYYVGISQTIRVEKGDLLSILTFDGLKDGSCNSNLVSTNPSEGKTTISTHDSMQTLTEGQTYRFINGHDNVQYHNASPALKAYVSAYMSLSDIPTIIHNESLSSGQVWLRLPPPLTSEESVVIVGYRLTCATTADMLEVVSCSRGLVQVNQEAVLLTLADIRQPYYAAVTIVRNIRGVEWPEGTFTTSPVFCTARDKTEDVKIVLASLPSEDGTLDVTIMFQHEFHENDSCASRIRLVSSGYNSSYRTINASLDRNFNLEVESGTIYNFAIYLLMKDSSEITLWSKEWSTSSRKINSATSLGSTTSIMLGALLTLLAANMKQTKGSVIRNVILLVCVKFRHQLNIESHSYNTRATVNKPEKQRSA